MIVRHRHLASIPLAISLMTGHAASAQTYPTRPITVIVPFGPGAATDMIPRLLSDGMSKTLGQPIIIDNRTGSGGTTGTAAVARAAPDGYTLLATVAPTITVNVFVQKNVPYDPRTAFAPVAVTANSPLMLAVHPSLPAKTVAEFVAYAKSNPGKISYGTPGAGTAQNILGELIKRRAGIDIVEIPYRGAANLIPDLVSGQLQAAWGTPFTFLPLAQDGKIRILGITDTKRNPDLPDIPAVAETVPGVIFSNFFAVYAPAGTPKPIVMRLNEAIVTELKKPDIVAKFKQQNLYLQLGTPEELGRITQEEIARWEKDIPMIGITPQ
jgi:tripartite-type tricarboxylate transporter receptor subunit TctC